MSYSGDVAGHAAPAGPPHVPVAGEPVAVLLPADHRRSPRPARVLARERHRLGPATAILALAERTASSTEAVLLAGFAALMARYTAQPTVAFATHSPGRWPDVIVVEVAEHAPFDSLVGRVARLSGDHAAGPAAARSDPPTGPTARPRGRAEEGQAGPSVTPIVGFAVLSPGESLPSADGELWARVIDGEHLVIDIEYDASVFLATTVRRLAGHYRTLVYGASAAPWRAVSELPVLSAEELHATLVTWNDTRVDLPVAGRTIPDAFAGQARERPMAVAMVDGDRRITYGEIEARAGRIAHHLRAIGVRRGVRVGLCLHRSPEFLIALLAVMKAGGAYVPLDPAYPRPRLLMMIEDAACALVVSCADLAAGLGATPVPLIRMDTEPVPAAPGAQVSPDGSAEPHDPCYVIYTSGSTGRPKGIELRHAGVLNNLVDLDARFDVGPGDAVLALSSLSFDMSVYEFLGVTVAGGTVVLPAADRASDPAHWIELIHAHHVTVWNSAPALLELLVGQAERAGAVLSSLRLALVGGDWIAIDLPDRLHAHAPMLRFVSLGGATEASIHSTIYEVTSTDPEWASIPYGRPMANQRAYLLDGARRPVPAGVPGELHLAGAGLAIGYVGDDELTAARFFDWSFGPVQGDRLYRTGDRARLRADGELELLGRLDTQVKIGGIRIETAEVEAVLVAHPAVAACAVAASRGRLVAYAVPHPDRSRVTGEELRAHAATALPAAFLPTAYVLVDALPLSPNGKVDRTALPSVPHGVNEAAAAGGEPPRDVWERRVADAWQQILGTGPLGRDSQFYLAGGDSLAAMRIVQRLDPDLPAAELYANPTVKGLAARLRARSGSADRWSNG